MSQDAEATAFLQRRVAKFAALSAGIGAAFFLQRVSQLGTIGAGDGFWSPALGYHALGTGLMVVLFVFTHFGERGTAAIRTAELVFFWGSCGAYIAMAAEMPQVFRPNYIMLITAAAYMLIRAIWIPSTWQWTALLSSLIGIPLLAAVWQHYAQIDPAVLAAFEGHDDFFEVTPENIRIDNFVVTLMWFVVTAGVASLASGVIHGLRREVHEARRLGQYVLEKKLGEGGMGVVYRARHAMLRRPTAIKLLQPERTGEANLARFEREVRAAARLSHPNIVTVYDYGRTPDGIFYYAMELLEGASLTELVEISGPMPPGRVAHFMGQVASALAEAHEAGLIHRDIKPDNIVVTRRAGTADFAMVIDFGLVREATVDGAVGITGETTIVGTPMYLAPEAIKSDALDDGRSDLYALGATAFFMLTGEYVFPKETVVEVLSAHLMSPPERPSARLGAPLPRDLEDLVVRCLAKDPDERPKSASALGAEVRALSCFGEWSSEDAAAWWEEHRRELDRGSISTESGERMTVQVDPLRN